MILGDGLYNFLKVLCQTIVGLSHQLRYKGVSFGLPVADHSSLVSSQLSYDDKRRTQLFLKDQIPTLFAIGGYVAIAAIAMDILPHIFHQLKWYLKRIKAKTGPDGLGQVGLTVLYPWAQEKSSPSFV